MSETEMALDLIESSLATVRNQLDAVNVPTDDGAAEWLLGDLRRDVRELQLTARNLRERLTAR